MNRGLRGFVFLSSTTGCDRQHQDVVLKVIPWPQWHLVVKGIGTPMVFLRLKAINPDQKITSASWKVARNP
ncbi:MAG: hypothetical protein ICV63_00375 [Coleofasciculus sp. Co-bin14]|nr:hypothetical protein [Coleofasciculus sp. Co-bin14]